MKSPQSYIQINSPNLDCLLCISSSRKRSSCKKRLATIMTHLASVSNKSKYLFTASLFLRIWISRRNKLSKTENKDTFLYLEKKCPKLFCSITVVSSCYNLCILALQNQKLVIVEQTKAKHKSSRRKIS